MAKMTPWRPTVLFVALLLLTSAPPSQSLSYTLFLNVFSLSHSLITRVANLRAARGDHSGSERARAIAAKMENGLGLGFSRFMWSAGWDYLRNYAWSGLSYSELYGAISEANELLSSLGELSRKQSDTEKAGWVGENYQNVLRASNSLLRRLLKVFYRSGTLRRVVETVQIEVVEGELLRDCLELGTTDLKGLVQILKDLGLQYNSNSHSKHSDL